MWDVAGCCEILSKYVWWSVSTMISATFLLIGKPCLFGVGPSQMGGPRDRVPSIAAGCPYRDPACAPAGNVVARGHSKSGLSARDLPPMGDRRRDPGGLGERSAMSDVARDANHESPRTVRITWGPR